VLGPLHGVAFAPVLDGRGPTRGFTASLFYTGGGDLTGVDLSFVNHRTGDVAGAQLATAFAGARDVDGVIGAAGATLAANVRGAQLAAGANVGRSVEGWVGAAGANVVESVEGASLAAGANITGEVHGAQIGVVNVARKVRGLQLGVVNVAEEVEGTAIGLISVAKNGEIQGTLYTSNHLPLHAALKFRVGYAYSEVGAAYDPSDDTYAFEYGLGAHLGFGAITVEPGVLHSTWKEGGESFDSGDPREYLHYRARVGWRFANHFELFAGGGVRHGAWGRTAGDVDPEVLSGIAVF